MHARPVALGTSAARSKRGACPWSCAPRQERSLRHPRDALPHLCVLSLGGLSALRGLRRGSLLWVPCPLSAGGWRPRQSLVLVPEGAGPETQGSSLGKESSSVPAWKPGLGGLPALRPPPRWECLSREQFGVKMQVPHPW